MGPHGLMIGMTGSGKSQTLMSILLSLLTTHSADRLIVIYADFKGEAGADIFRNFPQVVAVISNMAEKRSLADRFADTLRGEVARREQLLMEAGRRVQGSAFNSVVEYEAAIAAGHDLPPLPTLLVVADEFSLMIADHPEYAELFDYVARKGRSFRIHILFASQTLDVGRIKDIDKNTSYRIGLKVASPSVSRQIIGVEDAFHIEAGPEHKGEGFLVPTPGAVPVKFRSTYVDGIYDPPRIQRSIVVQSIPEPHLFTAGPVETAPDTVIVTEASELDERQPRKLVATIGEQLAHYGPKAPRLWLPPLEDAIPLDELLARDRRVRTPMALAARRNRQTLPDAARSARLRRDVGGLQRRHPRRPQVRQDHGAADVHPFGGRTALAARRDVLLPGLRRRSTSGAAGPRARRQRRVAVGARTHPAHVRRTGPVAARQAGPRRPQGRIRRGVPRDRQPLRVQSRQHRYLQHAKPAAGQRDRARQRRDVLRHPRRLHHAELAGGSAGDARRARTAARTQTLRRSGQQRAPRRRAAPTRGGRPGRATGAWAHDGRRALPLRPAGSARHRRHQRPLPGGVGATGAAAADRSRPRPRSPRCTSPRSGSSSASARRTSAPCPSTSRPIRCCWCSATRSPARARCCGT